jgi:hypothetical protein
MQSRQVAYELVNKLKFYALFKKLKLFTSTLATCLASLLLLLYLRTPL